MDALVLFIPREISLLFGLIGIFSVGYVILLQKKISRSLSKIAENKRLSTILSIEGKDVKSVPEDFAPDKKKILENLFTALDETSKHYKPGESDMDTWALVILSNSGFDTFVTYESKNEIKSTLARLLANGDTEKVKIFLKDIANQL